MSAELLLVPLLQAALNDVDVYPEHLPEKARLPAIVYRRIGGRLFHSVCDDDFAPLFQITIWARTLPEREQCVQAVMLQLHEDWALTAAPIYSFDFNRKASVAIVDYTLMA